MGRIVGWNEEWVLKEQNKSTQVLTRGVKGVL